ncbi:transposase [Sphingobacterium sp. IITKGP-BTPF85]|uniref:transposase n=1 Tax=Sphingobacterium sp. IITKGP-BTPF85 TaxID=1338009 RepID=UPI003979099C
MCRELEISKATFYNWKSRYGGMEASDVKRLKELEEENARLKKMFAELSMNHDILKEVITKKVGAPATKTVNSGNCPRSRFECRRSL